MAISSGHTDGWNIKLDMEIMLDFSSVSCPSECWVEMADKPSQGIEVNNIDDRRTGNFQIIVNRNKI